MMREYISREAAYQAIKNQESSFSYDFNNGLIDAMNALDEVPAADVREVVHGRWTLFKDGSGTCSECLRLQRNVWDLDQWQRFCGHCGAKMDLEVPE